MTEAAHTTIWQSGAYRCVLVTTDDDTETTCDVYLYGGNDPIAYERCPDPAHASQVAERLWTTLIQPLTK